MAYVYWIRAEDHCDFNSQGYIGVTTKTVEERFSQHKYNSNREKHRDYALSRAIRKYGANFLVVQVLIECSEEDAYCYEEKLRPKENLGWNIASGGCGLRSGTTFSKETRRRMSVAKKGISTGAKLPESIEKRTVGIFYSKMDKRPQVWGIADKVYLDYLTGLSVRKSEVKYGFPNGWLYGMYLRFKGGWIPLEDLRWTEKFNYRRANRG